MRVERDILKQKGSLFVVCLVQPSAVINNLKLVPWTKSLTVSLSERVSPD